MIDKPRVALVRGPGLSVFELQSYEPLLGSYDFKAFGLAQHSVDTDTLKIPVQKLRWKDSVSGKSVMNAYRTRFKHQRYYMPGLEQELKGFQLVHSSEIATTFSHQCALAKRKLKAPLVITSTENIPHATLDDPARTRLKKDILAAADFFFALTPDARDALIAEGVESSKIQVIPFGIDLERLRPGAPDRSWPQRFDIKPDDFVITFTGRLVWEKGIYDLLAAVRTLETNHLRLLIIGDGPEREEVGRHIKALGLFNVVGLHQAIPYGEIDNVYRMSNVVVLPSIPTRGLREQFGMVLVEAMACGVPVVATRCGSMPHVIGNAGLLADPGNPSSLADCLTRLRESESLRQQLGRRGREIAEERYDKNRVAASIGKVFHSLLERQ
jgi:starch synthase